MLALIQSRDIGYFDVLCPGQPEPSDSISPAKSSTSGPPQIRLTPSPNMNGNPPNNLVNQSTCYPSFPVPQPQVQGFALDGMRRRSSGTSATTMTTTGDYDPQPNGRPYSTVPASRQNLAFPNPHPAPHLSRSGTGRSIDISGYSTSMTSPSESAQEHERYTQSDAGHGEGNKRNSTGTTATFGRWDQGLKLAMGQDDGLDAVTERSPVSLALLAVAYTDVRTGDTRQRYVGGSCSRGRGPLNTGNFSASLYCHSRSLHGFHPP